MEEDNILHFSAFNNEDDLHSWAVTEAPKVNDWSCVEQEAETIAHNKGRRLYSLNQARALIAHRNESAIMILRLRDIGLNVQLGNSTWNYAVAKHAASYFANGHRS